MDVICISGKARSGKDTIATALKKEFTSNGKRAIIVHYADLLKSICRDYFEWDGNKDEKGRTLLQQVGEDFRRNDPNCWVEMMNGLLSGFGSSIDVAIIADCRYPNELRGINSPFVKGVYTVRVERDNFDNGLTAEQKNHKSEISLDDCLFCTYVKNNGTQEEFERKAKTILEQYEIFTNRRKNVI